MITQIAVLLVKINAHEMKTVTALILLFFSAQQQTGPRAFEKDFNEVADTFEREMNPYLYKFAKLQEKPLPDSATEAERIVRGRLIENSVLIYKEKAQELRKGTMGMFRSQGFDLNYTSKEKETIVRHFNFIYRTQFLFLDYHFYENVNKALE